MVFFNMLDNDVFTHVEKKHTGGFIIRSRSKVYLHTAFLGKGGEMIRMPLVDPGQ